MGLIVFIKLSKCWINLERAILAIPCDDGTDPLGPLRVMLPTCWMIDIAGPDAAELRRALDRHSENPPAITGVPPTSGSFVIHGIDSIPRKPNGGGLPEDRPLPEQGG